MPKTRINCPNCRQPITADIQQLFDVAQEPDAKQRLLSGQFNIVQCPNCGYQGMVATPIVYHDPEKELLLSYFPPELNMPRDEQERLIGSLINQVVSRLPQEKRKGYLLRPQSALTMQGLVERVLEADGITREMIQAQQTRLNLLQRFLGMTSDDVIAETARQEDKLIDSDFFSLLNRLIEAASMGGDQEGARHLTDLQQKLLPITTVGRQLQEQTKDVETAIRTIQDAGKSLTREKLLDIVEQAPNDTQLSVITSLARPGMDYTFFQILSERIDRARGKGRERLIAIRDKLLEMTREIDKQMETRAGQARQLLNQIIQAPDIAEAAQQNLPMMDEFFLQILNAEMADARKKGDLERIGKLQNVTNVIQQASTPPPEIALIEELLDIEDENARKSWLEAHSQQITPEFMETLTALMAQSQSSEDQDLAERLQSAYRSALRYSMEINMKNQTGAA
ncbi:MAG: CpXC domain-containing protein [Omnitrophica WOR_2 bacterium]